MQPCPSCVPWFPLCELLQDRSFLYVFLPSIRNGHGALLRLWHMPPRYMTQLCSVGCCTASPLRFQVMVHRRVCTGVWGIAWVVLLWHYQHGLGQDTSTLCHLAMGTSSIPCLSRGALGPGWGISAGFHTWSPVVALEE